MKEIGEVSACFFTMINIVGTIIISVLCLNHSSESDSDDEITMLLINIVPQLFCIILLIDFCIDDCCKNQKSGDCDCKGGDCGDCGNCNWVGGGGGGGDAGAALAIICLFTIAVILIFAIFYGLTKGIGKNPSRICSLGIIFFFEGIIAIYCVYLYFMDDDGEKFAFIFGVSLGLSVMNFVGLLIPCCGDCCSTFWSECCCQSCCHSQRKSIINQPIVKQNNIAEKNKDLLSDDFITNPIPITPQNENYSVENNYNYSSSIYNNNPNNTIYNNNNFYKDNMAIDNITKPSNDFDNNIERTGSNYDNAPLPYDLPTENEILENYLKNNNNNNNN